MAKLKDIQENLFKTSDELIESEASLKRNQEKLKAAQKANNTKGLSFNNLPNSRNFLWFYCIVPFPMKVILLYIDTIKIRF